MNGVGAVYTCLMLLFFLNTGLWQKDIFEHAPNEANTLNGQNYRTSVYKSTTPLRDSAAIKVVRKYCCRGSASIQTAVTLDPIRMQQMPD